MFNGYSTETVDFLWGIRFNNNREWFQANKDNYTKYLYHPTKAKHLTLYSKLYTFNLWLDRTVRRR